MGRRLDDEAVSEELKKVAPRNPPEQPKLKENDLDGDADLTCHLDLVSLKARGGGRSMQNDNNNSLPTMSCTTKRTRSAMALQVNSKGRGSPVSGLRTSLRQACGRFQSRDGLVEGVVARLRSTRNPLCKDVLANLQGHGGHPKATMAQALALFKKPSKPTNRAGIRFDICSPKPSPVSRTSEPPSGGEPLSVESGAVPDTNPRISKKRLRYTDGGLTGRGSDALGSKGSKGDDELIEGYEQMQVQVMN